MSPTFLWLFPVRVRQTFWTLNNGRVHMASCQEEGELFVCRSREWKRGCIVLPIQESFHILTKQFNSYTSENLVFSFSFDTVKCSVCFFFLVNTKSDLCMVFFSILLLCNCTLWLNFLYKTQTATFHHSKVCTHLFIHMNEKVCTYS